jgi:hypothetical protein
VQQEQAVAVQAVHRQLQVRLAQQTAVAAVAAAVKVAAVQQVQAVAELSM